MGCIDAANAVEFVDGALAPATAQQIETHVASCSDCRALIAAVARDPDSEEVDEPRTRHVLPGELIAERFEIVAIAGTGGMATVHRARDRAGGGTVALKLLRHPEPEAEQRFLQEARALSELSHPGIVRYLAHGVTAAGELYLAMEWLDGVDLRRQLRRGPLGVAGSVRLIARVAEALAVAHAHGVLHRDIKPSNLFLPDRDLDRVKLLDFGIARVRGASPLTRTGRAVGTVRFMAPEQARGQRDLDERVDVFALGSVLFACLTGRPPFAGDDELALLAKILLEEAPRASEHASRIPPALDDLVARMIAKDRARRPCDAAAVVAELAALGPLDGVAPTPRPGSLTGGEQRVLCVVLVGGVQPGALERVTAVVRDHGGTLEQIAGGALIVTLTGAGAGTDRAAQVARCALAVRVVAPGASMAVATGRWVGGVRWVGELLERAAGLLRRSGDDDTERRIHLDPVTAGLLDARFEIGGDTAGLELCGEREASEGARPLLGRDTPCVGRDRELAGLEALYAECIAEPAARPVVVIASAGVGKSRLRHELLIRLAAHRTPPAVWIGRGDPMRVGSPYGLIAPAVRRAAGILDGEPARVQQQKLRARVARHLAGGVLERVVPFLGELVGVPFDDDEHGQLRAARADPGWLGEQVQRAWQDWLAVECAAQPLVIVLEDLHWGDQPTVKLLDATLANLPDRALMVLALARPELRELFPRLWVGRGVTEIDLPGLSRRAAERLIAAVLGPDASEPATAALIERAGGNAFFLEELIRASADGQGAKLPDSVLASVQARLEAFPAEARRVLRAASVFGDTFWSGGVRTLVGGSDGASLDDWLAHLVDREAIVRRAERRFPAEAEYRFRHALVREAAYATLTPGDRTLGHRLAGDWLALASEVDAVVLAEHFERGDQPARAATAYQRAAAQALDANDLETAIALAERGVGCGCDGETLGALRLVEAEAHSWRARFADSSRAGIAAMGLLPPGSAAWCAAASVVMTSTGRTGDLVQLEAVAAALAALAPTPSVARDCAAALAAAIPPAVLAGRYALVDQLSVRLDAVLSELGAQPDLGLLAAVHRARGMHALCVGDPGDALAHLERSAAASEQVGDQRTACLQRATLGNAYSGIGAYGDAETILRSTVARAEALGLPVVNAVATHNLAFALAHLDRLDEARLAAAAAVARFVEIGPRYMEAEARATLALVLARVGELDAADREAQAAVALCGPGEPSRAIGLARLAQVRLARRDHEGARDAAAAAATLLDDLGGTDEHEGTIRLVHVEALAATGARAAARVALAAARARLAVRAARLADPVWRERFLSAIPEHARTLALELA